MSSTVNASENGETVLVAETGLGRYQVEARVGGAGFLIDEPISLGGLGSGPNPYDLLSAALGACTSMTIRMYAARKEWPLSRVRVAVTHHRRTLQARDRFACAITLEGDLDDEQKARLLEIAERCPVHLTLDRGADVETALLPVEATVGRMPREMGEHMKNMKEACDD
jgi:putative redox protein